MIYWDRVQYRLRSDQRGKRPWVWVVCEQCGEGRWVRRNDAKHLGPQHWCSKCGPKYAHWKGGRRTRPDGYIRVLAPEGHPHPCEAHRGVAYILEHRLVMEQKIGRYLEQKEVVHHLNGDPSDNRPDNLVLYKSQSAHIAEGHND